MFEISISILIVLFSIWLVINLFLNSRINKFFIQNAFSECVSFFLDLLFSKGRAQLGAAPAQVKVTKSGRGEGYGQGGTRRIPNPPLHRVELFMPNWNGEETLFCVVFIFSMLLLTFWHARGSLIIAPALSGLLTGSKLTEIRSRQVAKLF